MQHGVTGLDCLCVFILDQTSWSSTLDQIASGSHPDCDHLLSPNISYFSLLVTSLQLQICQFTELSNVDIFVTLRFVSRRSIFMCHCANTRSFLPQVHLAKLPKNLLAKASLTKNTEQVRCPSCIDVKLYPCNVAINIRPILFQVLQQLPNVISSLDAFMDSSLQR